MYTGERSYAMLRRWILYFPIRKERERKTTEEEEQERRGKKTSRNGCSFTSWTDYSGIFQIFNAVQRSACFGARAEVYIHLKLA